MIKSKFKICVFGLGYVGLPLAAAFGKKFKTIGYDINKKKIKLLKKNIDENYQINKKGFKKSKKLSFTNNLYDINDSNIFIITLPTPVDNKNLPDLSIIKSAVKEISHVIKKGDTLILESTVYPGVTEDICGKIIENNKKNFKLNRDYFLGYSPERINPGDKIKTLENIDKLISASNKKTLKLLKYIYSSVIKSKIIEVKSIKVAEAAKVIENTQRDINIALVNELSMLFNKLKIDTSQVLQAAGTKWNFHKYEPGLVGGHCIGVDPYYLTHIAKKNYFKPKIILAGRKTIDGLPNYISNKLYESSLKKKINLKKSNLLFCGLTFKENCNDFRNSKSVTLLKLVKKRVKNIFLFDPYINSKNSYLFKNYKILNRNNLKKKKFDIIILSAPHKQILNFFKKNLTKLLNKKYILFDIKNKLRNKKFEIDFTL